jgi:hypothetical protein
MSVFRRGGAPARRCSKTPCTASAQPYRRCQLAGGALVWRPGASRGGEVRQGGVGPAGRRRGMPNGDALPPASPPMGPPPTRALGIGERARLQKRQGGWGAVRGTHGGTSESLESSGVRILWRRLGGFSRGAEPVAGAVGSGLSRLNRLSRLPDTDCELRLHGMGVKCTGLSLLASDWGGRDDYFIAYTGAPHIPHSRVMPSFTPSLTTTLPTRHASPASKPPFILWDTPAGFQQDAQPACRDARRPPRPRPSQPPRSSRSGAPHSAVGSAARPSHDGRVPPHMTAACPSQ